MYTRLKKSGQQMAMKGTRKPMTQDKIDTRTQTIACTRKANRPLVLDKSSTSGEEVQIAIVRTSTHRYATEAHLTPLATIQYWDDNSADWTTKIDKAKQ